MRAAVGLAAGLLALALAAPAHAGDRHYAVIVAHNKDVKADVPPLEYADDDGARYFELYSHIADGVELYAVLDPDSQRLFAGAARIARPPRRDEVIDGVAAVFDKIRRDRAAGHRVEFTFILVGHGDIGAGGEGYVSLIDAPFTRSDLFQHVLARSPATTNHIIVDACNSYFLVHRRGGDAGDAGDTGPSRRAAVKAFLSREKIERYPNTGFVLSTSSAKESHEWSAYGAGVFSHQLRSAIAGAADVNRDGALEYSEIRAFVESANAAIADPRARVELHASAPAIDAGRPLVDLRRARFDRWLRIPRGTALRAYLEDARGVRYADFHASGESDVLLALVDSRHYFVRSHDDRRELRVPMRARGRIDLDRAALRRSRVGSRGAVAESFRQGLYAEAFGPGFYRGFIASSDARPVDSEVRRWLPALARDPVTLQVEERIARLSQRARRDRSLRERLRAIDKQVARALLHGDHRAALRLLDQAAGGR